MKNSEKFIDRIKKENIKPIPKWRFTYKNAIMWIIILLSTIIGAIAFSIILFAVQQIDFDLISHMSHSGFEMWLALLPFLWIISLIVFMLVSIFGMKKTKKGYKFSASRLIAGNVIFSILLGTLLFIGGGATWLENAFAVNVGFYEGVNEKKIEMWSKPDEGYLSGIIKSVDDTSLQLIDFDKNIWEIDILDANIYKVVKLEEGETIKLIGVVTSKNHFRADDVRPWGGGFGQNRNGRGRSNP